MDVSENSGTPKSSIWIGFSIINHPFWGTPIFGNIHIYIYMYIYRIPYRWTWISTALQDRKGLTPLMYAAGIGQASVVARFAR